MNIDDQSTYPQPITDTFRNTDELCFGEEEAGNLKIATWNANRMDEQKADYLAWYIIKKKLDICFIQDARVTLAAFRGINLKLKTALGGDTLIASTIKSNTSGEAGGQIVIINAALRKRVTGLWSDKTSLGLAMSITIDTTGSKMQVLSSYWPAKPVGPEAGGLHNATMQALRNVSDCRSPLDYVKDIIAQRLIAHQTDAGNNFVVVGDLNSKWLNTDGGLHGSCKVWAESLSLSNYPADNCKRLNKSFSRGTKLTSRRATLITF